METVTELLNWSIIDFKREKKVESEFIILIRI